jgi:pilus retraction protein PilT
MAVNDFSDDDFSFKGVAPADRQEVAPEHPAQLPLAEPHSGPDALLPPLPTAGSVPGEAGELFSFEDGLPREEGEDVALGAPGQPFMTHPLGAQPEQTEPATSAAGGPVVDHAGGGSTASVSPRHLVEGWLQQMVASNASDLILRSNGRPSQRLNGRIQFLEGQVPGPGPMLEVLEGILGARRMEAFVETGAADAALDLDGLGRFRINAYKQMGEPAIVIRRINEDAPSMDELHLPAEELKALALRKRGLVLVTGVAGSGKSTTLSAMIEFMNRNVERHIVTLEDPIELLFKERYCVISQREVGTDTSSFKLGLKHALRQSPDVILIGEMRDAETVLAALEAIETGHLVMSTMHTVNAAQTVDRILGYFPVERHAQIRQRIADTLAGVLSMRLVPRSGGGLIPAYELMSATPQVRELLEEGKTTELGRVIETGMEAGLVSLNSRLAELVQSGAVSLESACEASDRPDELTMRLRGIHAGVRGAARAEAQHGLASDAEPLLKDSSTPTPAGEGELRLRTRGR